MEELVGGGEAIFHPNIPWKCVFYTSLKITKQLRVDILQMCCKENKGLYKEERGHSVEGDDDKKEKYDDD